MKIDDPRRQMWVCEREGCEVEFIMWNATRRFCSTRCRIADFRKRRSTRNEALRSEGSGGDGAAMGGETTADTGTAGRAPVDPAPPELERDVAKDRNGQPFMQDWKLKIAGPARATSK